MVEIVEVRTKKQQREFVQFPIDLYDGNDCFVPPMWIDEMKIFKKSFTYSDTCDSVFYNAYRDGKIIGRISGIIQKASNEIRNEKRVRFTRFDSIDDQEVADALFAAVENWGASKGMDTVVGPLGYSDLEREGLLVDGFDQLSTFEEQYNAPYYQRLIENRGYTKEVGWTESKIYPPDNDDGSLDKMADFVMKRYNLHFAEAKNTNDFLKKYSDQFFDLLDRSYADIYGTVPFTDGMKKNMISNFKLIIDLKYVALILDENEKVVCLGIAFPSIAHEMSRAKGHLTPVSIVRLLKTIKHPKILDLGLIGVDPEYANRGISVAISAAMVHMLRDSGIEYAETNLNLEDNYAIQNQWKRFKAVQHKRRNAYVKPIARSEAKL